MRTPQHIRGARQSASNNLRAGLFVHTLRSVVLPLVVLGGLALFLLSSLLDGIDMDLARSRAVLVNSIAETSLMAQAGNVAREIDTFLGERMAEVSIWASNPVVVAATRSAHERHVAEGLTQVSIETIEGRFRIEKSLGIAPKANTYLLHEVASSPYFAEIFFTDRNGFNVALTNPTSDFVQSDEDWWRNAWSRGLSVGDVSYDDSAAVWSIDIAVRIDEPESKKPIGVMKTVLAIEFVQVIADRTAETSPDGRVLIAEASGTLIAETGSRHARERIMNPDLNIREKGEPFIRAAFGPERTGFVVDREWLVGYARTGGRDDATSVIGRFDGFDWIVIVQQPMAVIHGSLPLLEVLGNTLSEWHAILAFCIGGAVLLAAAIAIGLALGAANRYASALRAVRDLAERMVQGTITSPVAIVRPDEIARLNEAVSRLNEALKSARKGDG